MLAVIICVFLYGTAVGTYRIFPFHILKNAEIAAKDWIDNFKHYTEIKPEKFLKQARYEGSGVVTHLPDKANNGVTLITSFWGNENGFNLVGMDGEILHKWRVSLNEILPNVEKSVGDWDVDLHGAHLYPNGDVVFNFEYTGLVKINKNSEVIWTLPYNAHHSIFIDQEGYLWVLARKMLNNSTKRLPLLEPPIWEEMVFKVSPDGKVLKEISILDVFYNSGQEAILFANGTFSTARHAGDITHTNDIKILGDNIADKFPLFKTGDIMISMRHLNLIIIIDAISEKIKWSKVGPYIRQHDPDFLDNGHISVFDNHSDNTDDGSVLGGSRILGIDPVSRETYTIYGGNKDDFFYTYLRGKHQYLTNGNILITESDAGRVFEVTESGQVVWSFINRYDEDEVVTITDAIRLPNSYPKFIKGTKN